MVKRGAASTTQASKKAKVVKEVELTEEQKMELTVGKVIDALGSKTYDFESDSYRQTLVSAAPFALRLLKEDRHQIHHDVIEAISFAFSHIKDTLEANVSEKEDDLKAAITDKSNHEIEYGEIAADLDLKKVELDQATQKLSDDETFVEESEAKFTQVQKDNAQVLKDDEKLKKDRAELNDHQSLFMHWIEDPAGKALNKQQQKQVIAALTTQKFEESLLATVASIFSKNAEERVDFDLIALKHIEAGFQSRIEESDFAIEESSFAVESATDAIAEAEKMLEHFGSVVEESASAKKECTAALKSAQNSAKEMKVIAKADDKVIEGKETIVEEVRAELEVFAAIHEEFFTLQKRTEIDSTAEVVEEVEATEEAAPQEAKGLSKLFGTVTGLFKRRTTETQEEPTEQEVAKADVWSEGIPAPATDVVMEAAPAPVPEVIEVVQEPVVEESILADEDDLPLGHYAETLNDTVLDQSMFPLQGDIPSSPEEKENEPIAAQVPAPKSARKSTGKTPRKSTIGGTPRKSAVGGELKKTPRTTGRTPRKSVA